MRNLIWLWIRKYQEGEFNDEFAEAVSVANYDQKIAKPERKVGQSMMEVDLPKKGRNWDAGCRRELLPRKRPRSICVERAES